MKRADNRGLTLVELMISIAISAIVLASLALFMSYTSRNYRRASEEVSLQMEAQTVLNQLDSMIMESTNVIYDDAEQKLTITQGGKGYKIIIRFHDGSLYYKKVDAAAEESSVAEQPFGQYIAGFEVVDTGNNPSNDTIGITLRLEQNGSTYSVENHKVRIRNEIVPVS